jgi:urease subunit gamma/beta
VPLTPGESDRLLLHLQASLAQRRRDRGLRLNVPEARALIADAVCEWARDGWSWVQARDAASTLLGPRDVLPGVPEALAEIRVEARFDDGTRLVVVKDPFGVGASPGTVAEDEAAAIPPPAATILVTNEATTAIGLSSHIHLAEVNPRLRLDRAAAFGMRPAVATGETVWIRPGETVDLPVVPIAGARVAVGTSGAVDGPLDDSDVRERALALLRSCGYLDVIDGRPHSTVADADQAVAALVSHRKGKGA